MRRAFTRMCTRSCARIHARIEERDGRVGRGRGLARSEVAGDEAAAAERVQHPHAIRHRQRYRDRAADDTYCDAPPRQPFAVEDQHYARHGAGPRVWLWDLAFAGGSVVATFAQGLVLGAFITGFTLENGQAASGPFLPKAPIEA